jgi:hypothetical protein
VLAGRLRTHSAGRDNVPSLVSRIAVGCFFGFTRRFTFRRFLVEVALNRVQDSVYELRGFVGREAASNFQRFINRDCARCRFVQEFVNRESEHIAINEGHAIDAPVLGTGTNAFVDFFKVRKSADGEPRGKLACLRFELTIRQLRPEGARQFFSARSRYVSRKEHLQGAFARLTSRTHNLRWSVVSGRNSVVQELDL